MWSPAVLTPIWETGRRPALARHIPMYTSSMGCKQMDLDVLYMTMAVWPDRRNSTMLSVWAKMSSSPLSRKCARGQQSSIHCRKRTCFSVRLKKDSWKSHWRMSPCFLCSSSRSRFSRRFSKPVPVVPEMKTRRIRAPACVRSLAQIDRIAKEDVLS
ncbi:hypothetical protein CRUP_012192 [Coryphaenoides rupestris]|nr:hypothetical protein CRUP_012192 [Coryphaenoides rupestris]